MPNIEEMECPICEKIVRKEEIDQWSMCEDCHLVLKDTEEGFENEEGDKEAATGAVEQVVERYKARQAYNKERNQRPDVKAARKEYMRKRYQKEKAILKAAKERGLL